MAHRQKFALKVRIKAVLFALLMGFKWVSIKFKLVTADASGIEIAMTLYKITRDVHAYKAYFNSCTLSIRQYDVLAINVHMMVKNFSVGQISMSRSRQSPTLRSQGTKNEDTSFRERSDKVRQFGTKNRHLL
jgi:hypothetical protein